jgi:hypothetical protein
MRYAAREAPAAAISNACDALSQIVQDYRFAMLPIAWAHVRKRLSEKMFQQPACCANGIAINYRLLNSKIFPISQMILRKNFVNLG